MRTLRIGLLLGLRQIQRASIWTNTLIVFVMTLTFLNLVAVSGILVGLIEGSIRAFKEQYVGDIILTPKTEEDHILKTSEVVDVLDTFTEIETYSVRYLGGGTIEANYKNRRDLNADRDTVGASILGIDPVKEEETTKLSKNLLEGEYLEPGDTNQILIGSNYLQEFVADFGDEFDSLDGVGVGDKIRLVVGGVAAREFTIKGIVKSKVDTVSFRMFITDTEFKRLFNRFDLNADEIAVRLENGNDPIEIKATMQRAGLSKYAKIETFEEGLPKFLLDIKNTFAILGTFIGSIGIVVASITIFIIIFINALTRRKYIGILKGVGIERQAIEFSYLVQSAFYAVSGSVLGMAIVYGLLVPLLDKYPIDFPFSDGILVAPLSGTLIRFAILLVITLLAGFIPAAMIVRRNTLDSILGR